MENNQFAMVSEWMVNRNINEYVKEHWDANRFELVGFQFFVAFVHRRLIAWFDSSKVSLRD